MSLGNNILELRKKKGLTQEQLGEKVNVTRQTISNWELEETMPNPEQLKLLSNALDISIDELLDNDISNVLVTRVSNTEKLAGIIIKILKIIGISFIILFIIDIVSLIIYISTGKITKIDAITNMTCTIDNKDYEIELGKDKYFSCQNCSNSMSNEIKDLVDFNDLDSSINDVETYFKSKNGNCE